MRTDDCFTKEKYREMYHFSERQCKGLRAMAESIIEADKKIVVDIKTTGNNSKRDEILKLSIIDTDGNILYDGFFKPERDYHKDYKYLSKATGIVPEQIANAPTLSEQLYIIDKILFSANTIIGYSLGTIMSFFRESGCVWRTDYDFISIETAFELENDGKKNAALDDCAAYFDYHWSSDPPHNTLENCRAALHCYKKMLESGYELDMI